MNKTFDEIFCDIQKLIYTSNLKESEKQSLIEECIILNHNINRCFDNLNE